MKKIIVLFLFVCLCVGCGKVDRKDFPQPIMGTLPNGLSIVEAESIIANVCTQRGWRITNRAEGWMKIELLKKEYDFLGSITYNENNYTISMDNVISPDGDKDYVRRSKLFSKYASKLARSIQKYGLKADIRAQKYDAYKHRGTRDVSPIIINNNVGK